VIHTKRITRRLLADVLFAEQMMVDVAVDTQAFYMPTFNRVFGARLLLASVLYMLACDRIVAIDGLRNNCSY
jgi:hypothetical protein